MKLTFISLILALCFCACQQVAKQMEHSFIKMNNQILDSIALVSDSIDSLKTIVSGDSTYHEFNEVFVQIAYFDSTTQWIIQHIDANSSGNDDRLTPKRILVDSGYVSFLRSLDVRIIGEIRRLDSQHAIIPDPSLFPSNERKDFDEFYETFESLPVYASIPMLNKWRLERHETAYELLVSIDRNR